MERFAEDVAYVGLGLVVAVSLLILMTVSPAQMRSWVRLDDQGHGKRSIRTQGNQGDRSLQHNSIHTDA